MSAIELDLGPAQLAGLLPHREPIILVDRVLRYRPRSRPALEARLTLRGDEPIFAGHFPGRPIWPGAYMMEGLAQCAGLLLGVRAIHARAGDRLAEALAQGSDGVPAEPVLGLLARARIDLHEPVSPPAVLHYHVQFMGEFGPLARVDGEVQVDGRRVASGSVSIVLGLPP